MKIRYSWGRWMGVFVAMLLISVSGISFAADTSVNWQNSSLLISDESNVPLAIGSSNLIQFIYASGGIYHPPAPGTGLLGGGDSLILPGPFYIGEGGGGIGTFYKFLSPVTNPSTVYVRIWHGSTASQGPTNYYGRSPLRSVNVGPFDAPPPFSEAFNTVYIANFPPVPTGIAASNIGYDGATITWSLNSAYELTGEVLSYGTDAGASNLGTVNVSGVSYTFPRLSLLPGVQYYVKVKALNYFGSAGYSGTANFTTLGTNFGGTAIGLKVALSGSTVTLTWEGNAQTYEVWSADLNGDFARIDPDADSPWNTSVTSTTERYFQVRVPNGQGAPETVGWNRFALKKTGGTGINSISMPLNTTVSGNSPLLFKASDIKAQINSQSGDPNRFESIGGWDKAAQTDFGYLSNGSGVDFDIEKSVGYQVSVSADTDLVVVGQK